MRYLILGDIHSNSEALEEILGNEKYDKVLFLGDIIGYAAEPDKCYDRFLQLGGLGVLGNHESGAIRQESLFIFSSNARKGILHALKTMKPENLEHMKSLPLSREVSDIAICHTYLDAPADFNYIFPEDKDSVHLKKTFSIMKQKGIRALFTGHTHTPCIFRESSDGSVEVFKTGESVLFLDERPVVINPGSAGQARNRVPRAHYAVYDDVLKKVTFRTRDYDKSSTARKIREADLPEFLALRLFEGI